MLKTVSLFTLGIVQAMLLSGASPQSQISGAAESTSAISLPTAPPPNIQKPLSAQRAVGAFWRVDHTFRASIRITNNLGTADLNVTPVLYMADGTPFPLTPVIVPKHAVVTVDVNNAFEQVPAELIPHLSSYGTAVLAYSWGWQSAISGSILNLDVPRSLSFTSRFVSPASATDQMPGQQTIEGLWWQPYRESANFISIYNDAASSVATTLQIFDHNRGTLATKQFSTAPKTTQLLQLSDLIPNADAARFGGIRVSYEGNAKQLVVDGGVEDDKRGYSAAIPIVVSMQSMPNSAGVTHFSFASAGMMIGQQDQMMGFPPGIQFEPYAFLRNTATSRIQVAVSASYVASGQPQAADLDTVTLQPNETLKLPISSLLAKKGVHHLNGAITLVFGVDGPSDSLLTATGSVDQSGTYVFEVEPQSIAKTAAKQLPFWNIGSGNDTMISLWNPASTDQDMVLTFFYVGGKYQYPVHLAANGSASVSVRDLQSSGTPDSFGNDFQISAVSGSVLLASDRGEDEDLTVVVSVGTYNVSTATCGTTCPTCLGIVNVWIAPNPFGWPDLYDIQLDAFMQNTSGGIATATSKSSWTSDNTGVASVVSPGTFYGSSLGSFDAFASLTAISPDSSDCPRGSPCPTQPWNPSNPGTVSNLTPSQHTYPNSPLGGSCRVSTCFDCIVNTRTKATHKAQDVALPTVGALQVGAPVYAAEGGTVARTLSGQPHASSDAGTCAGQHYPANYVEISDGNGAITRYVHVSPTVATGTPVSAGQQIGTVDISGCSTGAHVHIGRYLNGAVVNFTLPCDNSHFDPASNWIDDTDQ